MIQLSIIILMFYIIDNNNYKTLIKFDKETFLLAGWVTLDQYNNQIIFEIQINSINQIVDDNILIYQLKVKLQNLFVLF